MPVLLIRKWAEVADIRNSFLRANLDRKRFHMQHATHELLRLLGIQKSSTNLLLFRGCALVVL